MKKKTFYIICLVVIIIGFAFSCSKESIFQQDEELISLLQPDETIPVVEQKAVQRELAEFISAQGTTSDFLSPVPDFFGWGSNLYGSIYRLYAVDYLGVARDAIIQMGGPDIGTSIQGTVSEVPLADGRAKITVTIHARNSLLWATDLDFDNNGDFAKDPLIFGARPADVVAGVEPSLADVNFQFVFTLAYPGAPIPDIMLASFGIIDVPGYQDISLYLNVNARGTLHTVPLHELPWAEGDFGMLSSAYKAIFNNNPNHHSALARFYGWPNDHLVVKKVGNNN